MTMFKNGLMGVCAALVLCLPMSAGAAQRVRLGSDNVRLRVSPALGSAEVALLRMGQTVEVLSEKNGWYEVSAGGRRGWAFGGLVGACDAQGRRLNLPGQSWVGLPVLSVREPVRRAPSSTAAAVGTLDSSSLYVLHRQDAQRADTNPLGFTRVRLVNGATGFVRNVMVDSWVCQ